MLTDQLSFNVITAAPSWGYRLRASSLLQKRDDLEDLSRILMRAGISIVDIQVDGIAFLRLAQRLYPARAGQLL